MEKCIALFSRWRPVLAGCLAAVAFALLWMGFGVSRLLPTPTIAVADSFPANYHNVPPDSVLPHSRATLLQSSVDSVALGLGGALASLPDEHAKRAALAKALNSLTFDLGEEVYFTAWQGTRILHSPLTPDTMNMDFADALDERGSSFVRAMQGAASDGGGFVQVTLPRQLPRTSGFVAGGSTVSTPLRINADDVTVTEDFDSLSSKIVSEAHSANAKKAEGAPVKVRSDNFAELRKHADIVSVYTTSHSFSLEGSATASVKFFQGDNAGSTALVADSTPVAQVVYTRLIPQSSWYIAAFMPTDATRADNAFSSAWAPAVLDEGTTRMAESDMRKGLCVSGFSFAGLAGMLLVPGRRRESPHAGTDDTV